METTETKLDNETEISKNVKAVFGSIPTFAESEGLNKSTLEGLYAYAYDFYENGRLDEAETFFKFLCIYDFTNADYLKGYAAVCQLKKQYQKACDLYGASFTVNKERDYSPIYFIGQCLLCMKNVPSAVECFSNVVANSKDEELKEKAIKYLELLEEFAPNDASETQDETEKV